MEKKQSNLYKAVTLGNSLGPVPERPISVKVSSTLKHPPPVDQR